MRNSERRDFKDCQKKWWWRWEMGLVPAMPKTDARWFGTGWHLVWAEYYTPPEGKDGFTRGRDPHETWDEFCRNEYAFVSAGEYWDEVSEKEWVDAVALGHIMIDGYLAQYKGDPTWEVLMPEQRFRANIPFNDRQSKMPPSRRLELGLDSKPFITTIVGTFDMPIRNHGYETPRIEIVDHKTTNKRESVRHLTKDDQPGTYIAVGTGYLRKAGLIGPKEAITGAIWNYSRKGKPPNPETTDNLGRVRNKPLKKHYAEQMDSMTIDGVYWQAEALLKLKLDQLEALAGLAQIRVLGDVSKVQPAPLFWRESVERGQKNRLHQIARIADDAEQMLYIRNGIIGATKNPGEHCNWCDFSDLCDLDENGDETEGFIKAVYREEDPYADHREKAVNSKATVSNKKETKVT